MFILSPLLILLLPITSNCQLFKDIPDITSLSIEFYEGNALSPKASIDLVVVDSVSIFEHGPPEICVVVRHGGRPFIRWRKPTTAHWKTIKGRNLTVERRPSKKIDMNAMPAQSLANYPFRIEAPKEALPVEILYTILSEFTKNRSKSYPFGLHISESTEWTDAFLEVAVALGLKISDFIFYLYDEKPLNEARLLRFVEKVEVWKSFTDATSNTIYSNAFFDSPKIRKMRNLDIEQGTSMIEDATLAKLEATQIRLAAAPNVTAEGIEHWLKPVLEAQVEEKSFKAAELGFKLEDAKLLANRTDKMGNGLRFPGRFLMRADAPRKDFRIRVEKVRTFYEFSVRTYEPGQCSFYNPRC